MTADAEIAWCRRQQALARDYIESHAGSYVEGARACIRDSIMEEIIIMERARLAACAEGERDEQIKESIRVGK